MARRIGQNCEEEIYCRSYSFENTVTGNGNLVPFRVAECTEYQPFNQQDLKSMYDIAWIVQVRKRGPAGFGDAVKTTEIKEGETVTEIVPPKKRKDEDEDYEY
jgi:hypothetical protein